MQARPAVAPRAQAQGFEKGLSGDVLAMFHEAQRNILELNKSRLMALDELRQARERIEELGAPLGPKSAVLVCRQPAFSASCPERACGGSVSGIGC